MEVAKLNQKAVDKAARFLRRGGVVIFPTDTIYGFIADAASKKAVNKIYKIKKRAKSKPLPVFVKDIKAAKEVAEIDPGQEKILKEYWPGKYTFVLKRRKEAKLYGQDKKTIALRIPKYRFLNALLKKINKPLVQTSVNISDGVSLGKMDEITRQFGNYDILAIDARNIKRSNASKVFDLTAGKLTVLR